jgi:hypothetical protein
MNDSDLDRTLAGEEDIVPSPAFTASVMRVVRQEQASQPIAFPWTRALPGFSALFLSVTICIVLMIRGLSTSAAPVSAAFSAPATFANVITYAAGWVIFALLLTLLSIMLSVRIRRANA